MMTYEDYKTYQIFEGKRLKFSHIVSGSNTLTKVNKKRVGKLITYYESKTSVLQANYESLSESDAISLYDQHIRTEIVGKEYKRVQYGRTSYIKITGFYKVTPSYESYHTPTLNFSCETVGFDPTNRILEHKSDSYVIFKKGRRGRIIIDLDSVKVGTVEDLKGKVEEINKETKTSRFVIDEYNEQIRLLNLEKAKEIEKVKNSIDTKFPNLF